jgi:hypothetical protein
VGLVVVVVIGAVRTITDQQVEQVLVTTLETTPADATHWSTAAWPATWACRSRPLAGSGGPLGSSRAGDLDPPDQDPAEAAAGAGVAVGLEQPDPDGGRPCLGAAVEGDDPPGAGPRKDMPWAPCWLLPMPCP